jgi:alpha-amylase
MPAIILHSQIHLPYRLRPYTVFDLGENHLYEDADVNRDTVRRLGENAYLPMNDLLLELIRKHKGKFKASFSISGTALDQLEAYAPRVLDSFARLAHTGNVEFIGEPYTHSLAFLYSREEEFRKQVAQHRARVRELFGMQPLTFRNTELIYNNDLASFIEDRGYEVMLSEGADRILGWRSPNFVYQPANCHKLRLLLRNYRLSDDVAVRFSDRSWPDFPLTAEKFASWAHGADVPGDVINLFMDYEAFGDRHHKDTGIFDFMRALPGAVLAHPGCSFLTPLEAARTYQAAAKIDVPQYISWVDAERDLTAWLGNDMQLDAIESLYKLENKVMSAASPDLLSVWRRLQTSDHFHSMSTKWLSDGSARRRSNPYNSPYDAYINFMNVLADFELTVNDAATLAVSAESVASEAVKPAAVKTEAVVRLPAEPADAPAKKPRSRASKPAKAAEARASEPEASPRRSTRKRAGQSDDPGDAKAPTRTQGKRR